MKKYNQQVTSPLIGDCFRACMATVLQLPPEVLPNDHSPGWHNIWAAFFRQFGLDLMYGGPKDAIFMDGLWIAIVKSLNFKETTHAIVMTDSKVYHDPSNKKRYKAGTYLSSISKDAVILGGYHLVVDDATLLHRLEEYRQKITLAAPKSNVGGATNE